MPKTNQGHRLKDIWEVEDAVASASQSAAIAKQYHQLTAQNVSAVSLELDRVNQKLSFAVNEISRLEGLITGSRNSCLVWGIGGAIISSLVMSLVTAPFNPPQRATIQPTIEPVSEIIQPAPTLKPTIVKLRSTAKVKARRNG